MNIKKPSIQQTVIPEEVRQNGVKYVSEKDKLFETILKVKSKQFVFDCGAIMGKLSIDSDDRFCLRYHYNLAKQSVSDKEQQFNLFVQKVREFLESTNSKLTDSDINKLRVEFDKFSK